MTRQREAKQQPHEGRTAHGKATQARPWQPELACLHCQAKASTGVTTSMCPPGPWSTPACPSSATVITASLRKGPSPPGTAPMRPFLKPLNPPAMLATPQHGLQGAACFRPRRPYGGIWHSHTRCIHTPRSWLQAHRPCLDSAYPPHRLPPPSSLCTCCSHCQESPSSFPPILQTQAPVTQAQSSSLVLTHPPPSNPRAIISSLDRAEN